MAAQVQQRAGIEPAPPPWSEWLRVLAPRPVSAHEYACEPDWQVQPRRIRDHMLWIVRGGAGVLQVPGRALPMESGDVVYVGPATPHSARHDARRPLRVVTVHFEWEERPTASAAATAPGSPPAADGDPGAGARGGRPAVSAVAGVRGSRPEGAPSAPTRAAHAGPGTLLREAARAAPFRVPHPQPAVLEAPLDRLLEVMLWRPPEWGELARCLVELLLVEVAVAASALRQRRRRLPEPVLRAVRRAEQEGGWCRPADLARAAGLSPAYFSRLFRAATGRDPQTFLIERRMQAAQRLLAETALPVAAVAARLGYADPYFFTRQFTARVGCAPRRFRRRAQAGDVRGEDG